MYRQSEKYLHNNIFSTCPHNMVNFGPLKAEIGLRVWGTTNKFQRVLASLLHRRRSTEVNQTLHHLWPSPGLVHYIHFVGSCPLTKFCEVQNALCVQVLRSPILVALSLLHDTRTVCVCQTLRHGIRKGITELSLQVQVVGVNVA